MAVSLNTKGNSNLKALINGGKVDKTSEWSMSVDDENAMMTEMMDENAWSKYGEWFLGVDDAEGMMTKAHYKYPFGKGGKVYRSALTAIRQRAGQQDANDIFDAAGSAIEMIDKEIKQRAADAINNVSNSANNDKIGNYTIDGVNTILDKIEHQLNLL